MCLTAVAKKNLMQLKCLFPSPRAFRNRRINSINSTDEQELQKADPSQQ